jgi:hypothetical protein
MIMPLWKNGLAGDGRTLTTQDIGVVVRVLKGTWFDPPTGSADYVPDHYENVPFSSLQTGI